MEGPCELQGKNMGRGSKSAPLNRHRLAVYMDAGERWVSISFQSELPVVPSSGADAAPDFCGWFVGRPGRLDRARAREQRLWKHAPRVAQAHSYEGHQ